MWKKLCEMFKECGAPDPVSIYVCNHQFEPIDLWWNRNPKDGRVVVKCSCCGDKEVRQPDVK
jgi:hypothetical protein